MLELQVRQGELKRAIWAISPALERMGRDPFHRKDARLITTALARLAIQDANRTPS